jgi:hypothetical protein
MPIELRVLVHVIAVYDPNIDSWRIFEIGLGCFLALAFLLSDAEQALSFRGEYAILANEH